jgi:hypothetical protein
VSAAPHAPPVTPPLTWSPREPPLAPVAVTAPRHRTAALVAAAVARARGGAELRAAAAAGRVVVLGDGPDLPWCDGVIYLGRDAGLLLPTATAPSVPAALLHEAVRRLVPPGCGLVAVLPDAVLAAPVPARRLDAVALATAVAGAAGAVG